MKILFKTRLNQLLALMMPHFRLHPLASPDDEARL